VTILTPAERLLQELGITEPNEIDLEAIAYHVGAHVRYRPLDGCEARIIGRADNAIITVNEHSSCRRKRFSIAHELGHWCHHRGNALVCRVEEIRPRDPTSPERVADAYAADLLMPHYLFARPPDSKPSLPSRQ
jgi:IrrE N-terminal-like domain